MSSPQSIKRRGTLKKGHSMLTDPAATDNIFEQEEFKTEDAGEENDAI